MPQHPCFFRRCSRPTAFDLISRLRAALLYAALALWLSPAVAAEESPLQCNRSSACELQIFIENDSVGNGTDRYYTNGIKVGGGVNADRVIDRLLQTPARSALERISDHLGEVHVGFFLGQNLYTPRRITLAQPQPFDRPWAAWLYVGGVAQSVLGNRLQTVELDVGMVGPAALGKPVQTEWHKWVDADHPRGWDNQLRNEPGLLLAYLEKWRYGPVTGVQAVPHFGATLGNVMTLVRAGGIVRLGQNMSGFGPDTIEPGGAMLQRTRLTDSQSQNGGREWYVFAGVDARLVGRNIFLDGNTFRDGPSVERKGYVHDFKAGFSLRIAPMRISLTHVRRSPEFTTPAGGSGIQRFHSLNVGWEF
jgi:lipid A 3-O-deacylase